MQADTVANLGTADLYVYMVHDASSQWGTAGIAYRSVVCGHYPYKKYQQSINEWRKQGSVAYGAVDIKFWNRYLKVIKSIHRALSFLTACGSWNRP